MLQATFLIRLVGMGWLLLISTMSSFGGLYLPSLLSVSYILEF